MTSRSTNLKRKSQVRRTGDPIPWKYCLLTLVCGLLLVSGFFWAARQHFASMDYGMKNAKLRKQIDELKSEKRRHQLSREIALTPGEIKKAAKKLGLKAITAKNIEVIRPREINPEININNADSKNEIKAYDVDTKSTQSEDKNSEKIEINKKESEKESNKNEIKAIKPGVKSKNGKSVSNNGEKQTSTK
jgi:hypothetical protein